MVSTSSPLPFWFGVGFLEELLGQCFCVCLSCTWGQEVVRPVPQALPGPQHGLSQQLALRRRQLLVAPQNLRLLYQGTGLGVHGIELEHHRSHSLCPEGFLGLWLEGFGAFLCI